MRNVLCSLLAAAIATPATAQFAQYGAGCNGGTTSTCIAQNQTATFMPYGSLTNEYAHAVINPVTNGTVTVIGFRVQTNSVLGTPITVGTGIYRDSSGAGALAHTTPALLPEGRGTIDVAGPTGWYTTYVYPAMIVAPGEAFWIACDTNGINPPDARLGGASSPPAPSYWRRPAFGGTAWAVTGIVQDPIYEILCHGSTEVPVLSASAPPAIGTTMNLDISHADPLSPAAFLSWGLNNTNWNGLPLPLDLTPFGIAGCTLYINATSSTLVLLSGGAGAAPFVIPNQTGLIGVRVYNQYAEVRPAVASGVVLSNASIATIQ